MNNKRKILFFALTISLIITLWSNSEFHIQITYDNQEYIPKFLNQASNNSWNQEWDTIYHSPAYGYCITFDSEENVIVGCYLSNGFALVKYNSSGVKLWETYFMHDWVYYFIRDIETDSFNNIYVVGWAAFDLIFDRHYFIIKFNQSGNFEWEKLSNEVDYGYSESVAVDSSDGIYICSDLGNEESEIVLAKYNNTGNETWIRKWSGNTQNLCSDIEIDSLDNIYVLGITNNTEFGDLDIILLKYSKDGDLLWNYTWGESNNDRGFEIALDSSEQVNIFGTTENNENTNTFLVKIDDAGVLIWNRTFDNNIYNHFTIDSNDNYYFTKTGEYFEDQESDIYIATYNNSGDFQLDLIWGGEFYDSCYDIKVDSNDNIYLTGYTRKNKNMILVKNPIDKSPYSPPGIFTLNSSTSNTNNTLNLIWTNSRGAENYSIYLSDDYFRDISNSSTLLVEGIMDNDYSISGFQDGVYFFIITAQNRNGYTVSDCIYVIIGEQSQETGNNIIELYLLFVFFMGIGVIYVVGFTILYRKFFIKPR